MQLHLPLMKTSSIAFIGGGNMASAIIGGLLRQGRAPSSIMVVEPFEAARAKLLQQYGLLAQAQADGALAEAGLVVWAVKPQMFAEAAEPCQIHVSGALHLSVMAGIRSDAIARAVGTQRVVRAMPNTPALIGQGVAGLFARAAVSGTDKELIETVLAPTGQMLWVDAEADLDAVTALSGSGPAYVFYMIEAMMQAAKDMGLSEAQGRTLALATCAGATALAQQSADPPSVLREQVTSKGGTTYAALNSMESDAVKAKIVKAILAAQLRARELGDEA